MADIENFDGRPFTVDPAKFRLNPLSPKEGEDDFAVLDELAAPIAALLKDQAALMEKYPFLTRVGIKIAGSAEVSGEVSLYRLDIGSSTTNPDQVHVVIEGQLGRGLRSRLGKPIPAFWEGRIYWRRPKSRETYVSDGDVISGGDTIGWWVDADKQGGEVESPESGQFKKALEDGASVRVGDTIAYLIAMRKQQRESDGD